MWTRHRSRIGRVHDDGLILVGQITIQKFDQLVLLNCHGAAPPALLSDSSHLSASGASDRVLRPSRIRHRSGLRFVFPWRAARPRDGATIMRLAHVVLVAVILCARAGQTSRAGDFVSASIFETPEGL